MRFEKNGALRKVRFEKNAFGKNERLTTIVREKNCGERKIVARGQIVR
jgi:hypothetical protein